LFKWTRHGSEASFLVPFLRYCNEQWRYARERRKISEEVLKICRNKREEK